MLNLEFLQYSYFGNTVQNYLTSVGIFVLFVIGAYILNFILKGIVSKWAKKTKTKLDDTICEIMNKVLVFVLILGGVYFGLQALEIPENVWIYIEKAIQVLFIIKIFQGITIFIDFIIENYITRILKLKEGFDIQITRLISRIVNIGIWIIGASMIIKLFGYDIGGIIAGLGIGGLAIALAAQDTLGNFFSSISIMADRPYKIGDIVKFGEYEGVIQDIGMRTTRIETFFGTRLSVPNSELAKSVVENESKRLSRRADGAIGIVYDSTATQIRKGIKIIKDILDKEDNITKEFRVFFTEYDPSSLRIEFTYFVKNPQDYKFFLKTKNKINLAIKEAYDKEGLEMAFPTTTVYLKKEA